MKIDDKYKVAILLCSLPGSYDYLVTTLSYEKYIISLDMITTTYFSHSQGDKMYKNELKNKKIV